MALSGWAVFILVVIILAAFAYGGWVLWSRRRASSLGLPPPSLNPFKRRSTEPSFPTPRTGGLVGWVNDKIRAFKNRRYASGAYEEGRGGAGARGGVGGRQDDEAWDARVGVGNDHYYEEQELGLHGAPTAYGGSGYGAPPPPAAAQPSPYAPEPERGRSRTRDFDPRFDSEDLGARGRSKTPTSSRHNPFGDNAEPSNISMRGVSPRPVDTHTSSSKQQRDSTDESPTERRSIFRENM